MAWRVFSDVAPAIERIRRIGIKLLIGSNFDSRLRGVVAGLPEIADLESTLVISSEIGVRKPHPRFFRAACERLGCEPSGLLCVGDDERNDVQGAIRAGAHAVLVDRLGKHNRDDEEGFRDLLPIVAQLVESA